jgi:hypothetical protein
MEVTALMNYDEILLMLIVVSGLFLTGCTQSSRNDPGSPAVPVTTLPPAEFTAPVPVAATSTPRAVVTIIHQISQVRDVKDSELLFTLQVPVEWNVSSFRMANPENFEGSMYQTDLVRNNMFFIHTFTSYHSRDQNYRDECRRWSPAPNESVVTINGMTFDRFESTANGRTNVTYVARKTSVNERGYLSVLAFSANTSNRFEKEDYEKVVSSFRYFRRTDANTAPGEEIVKIAPQTSSGNVRSRSGGSNPGSSGSQGGCGCGG